MDGRTTAAIACVLAGSAWALFGGLVLGRRLRLVRRGAFVASLPPVQDAHLAPWAAAEEWRDGLARARELEALAASDAAARKVLGESLRSRSPAERHATVTALGRLGTRHEWAIDGLIEALAEHLDAPATVAAQLDRLAPRVGARLLPLLEHPRTVVRFYALRLLTPYPELVRGFAPDLVRDVSPNVRAAALEALASVATGDCLRRAFHLLDDPHPLVRAQACRTADAISALTAAPFVVALLADSSWWVREAARDALVAAGPGVAPHVVPLLDHEDQNVRAGAALVLQDVGVLDDLLAEGGDHGLLERIFTAGGQRVRAAAAERARHGLRVGGGGLVPEGGRA